MKKALNTLSVLLFFIFCIGIFFVSVRGHLGNPTPEELNTPYWKDEGPLELSPERGRFSLIMSVVENGSFWYSLPIARFTTPDLGFANGNYVSLFAPGVSFLVMPGYIIGKALGASQVGTFFVVSMFAILNGFLIREIAKKLGATPLAATIGAFTFLFATPAFAYGVTLYQHHISTFLILLSLYTLIRYSHIASLILVWLLFAMSIPVDYPNVFLMAPIALFAGFRILLLKATPESVKVTLKIGGIFTFIGAVLPIMFFLWFNNISYGNPFQLSGTLPSVKEIDAQGRPTLPRDAGTDKDKDFFTDPTQQNKSAVGFFKTRNMIQGLYIHTVSPDRGIIYYTPVVLFGIFAIMYLYKTQGQYLQVMLGIIGMNILLYSMWGDPWGGWAFASRYLIPTYAMMAILIGVTLTLWSRKSLLLVLFFLIFAYSASVNTLGAVTSNRNPPKIEVLGLEAVTGRQERYTFTRNWEFLLANRSKSFVFQTYLADKYTAIQYYWTLVSIIISAMYLMLMVLRLRKKETV